jgi:hypothetical protein
MITAAEARQIQPLKQSHRGRQYKAQQHGEGNWQQYFSPKVNGRDNQGSD